MAKTKIFYDEKDKTIGCIYNSYMSQEEKKSLFTKVVKSASWTFLGKFYGRLIEFIKSVALARLLSPEQFGLFGLVMVAVFIVDTLSQTGMRSALIQHKGETEKYIDTAWSIQIIRGCFISLALFTVAPMVGWIFNEPKIILLLRVVCLSPLIQGFVNIGTVYFDKELNFKKQVFIDCVSSSISLLVGVSLAYLYRSVWALVVANISMCLAQLIFSFLLSPCSPKLSFNKSHAAELFRFGKWISGYTVILSVCQQVDKIIVGKILGPVALGYYQVAQRLSELPVSNIAISSINFTFPAYSKMQYDKERLRKAFLDIFEAILSLVSPVAIYMIFAAEDIVYALLGANWANAIMPLRILSFAGIIMTVDVLTTPIYMSLGFPKIEVQKNIVRGGVLTIMIIPLTHMYGLKGTCFAVTASVLSMLPYIRSLIHLLDVRCSDIISRITTSVLVGLSTSIGVICVKAYLSISHIMDLITSFTISILCFCFVSYLFGKYLNVGSYVVVRRMLKINKVNG